MPITFKMLLNAEKIDPREVRLVRYHYTRSNRKVTPYRLWRRGGALLEQYQRIQAKEVFKVGDILASFVRTPNGKTLFVGLYRVNSQGIADESDIDPSTGLCTPGRIKYDISKDDRLKDMQGRLVVDWGKGFLAWVQHADRNDKDVVELLRSPEDEPFPGYFRFRWSLKEVGDLPQAWAQRLREATGVYLLTSATTKEHYVGSAAGQGGFFERWKQHAKVGGDAVGFRSRESSEFQVAILQVSAGFETEDDIVRTEHAWMDKLQSRSMGLNGNPTSAVKAEPLV